MAPARRRLLTLKRRKEIISNCRMHFIMMVPKPQYYRERTVPRKCLDPAIFFSEPLVLPSWIDVLLKYPAGHTYCNNTGIWERPAGIPSRSNMKIMLKERLNSTIAISSTCQKISAGLFTNRNLLQCLTVHFRRLRNMPSRSDKSHRSILAP